MIQPLISINIVHQLSSHEFGVTIKQLAKCAQRNGYDIKDERNS